MVRVTFLIDQLAPGAGTENQLLGLLEGLDRSRVEPRLITLTEDPSWPLTHAPCPAHALGVTRLGAPAGMRAILAAARRLREHADLAITFFPDASFVGVVAARLAGRPVLTTRRNLAYDAGAGSPRRYRLLNRWTRRVIANADAVAQAVRQGEGLGTERIEVIPNAVDLVRFHPPGPEHRAATRERLGLPREGPLWVCVANLRPVKGHALLLESMARLGDAAPHLALIGGGPLRAELESRVETSGLAGRVRFLGALPDAAPALAAADGFVLASSSEGMPNGVLEAMAAGLPVVATDVGGTRELLGEAGRLVPSGDGEALSDALAALSADPQLRLDLGTRARARAEAHHAPKRVFSRWAELCEREAARSGA